MSGKAHDFDNAGLMRGSKVNTIFACAPLPSTKLLFVQFMVNQWTVLSSS